MALNSLNNNLEQLTFKGLNATYRVSDGSRSVVKSGVRIRRSGSRSVRL